MRAVEGEGKADKKQEAKPSYTSLDEKAIAEQKVTSDALVKWMVDNGAEMPNLYFKYYAVDHRGVHINGDCPDGNIMVSIPPELLITVERGKEGEIGQKIIKSGIKIRSHGFVAAFILEEKRKQSSFWDPYIDILPKSYRHIPTQFTDRELAYLRGSLTLEEVYDRRDRYAEEHKKLLRVPGFDFTLQEWTWARIVVLTRIFGITVDGNSTSALVPMADMLNHKYPAETYWTFDQKRRAFTITAQQNFTKGMQVYDSYGRKGNTEFFLNYGFVPDEDNPNNECKLILSFPEDVDLYAYKLLLLPSDLHQVQVGRDYGTEEAEEMWAFLRLAYCSSAEFFELTGGGYDVDDVTDIPPRNLRNELQVLHSLRDSAIASLEDFDCGEDRDLELLQRADELGLSRNIQNCIKTRVSEKQTLHWYVNLCDIMLGVITPRTTRQDFQDLIARHPMIAEDKHVRKYARSVILPLLDDGSVGSLIRRLSAMKVEDYQDARYRIPTQQKQANAPHPLR